MPTLKTKITKLKREIKELQEGYVNEKKDYEDQLKISEKERNLIKQEISQLKKLNEELFEILDQECPKINELTKINNVKRDEWKKIKEEHYQNHILPRLFSPKFPDEFMDSWEKIRKELKKKQNRISSIVDQYQKKYSITIGHITSDLNYDCIDNPYCEKIKKTKKAFSSLILVREKQLKPEYRINSSLIDGLIEVNEEKKDKINKKKNELEKLEKRYQKLQRDKAFASAYIKNIRANASTLKKRLIQGEICPYCGNNLKKNGEADHIYPVALGGLSIKENMILVCKDCNRKKGNLTLREFIEQNNLDRKEIENRLKLLNKKF